MEKRVISRPKVEAIMSDDVDKFIDATDGVDSDDETTQELNLSSPTPTHQIPLFMQKLVDANITKFGDKSVTVGTETRVVGIEPYGIVWQYLMDLDGIPLHSIVLIDGEAKTYKTSLALEFGRMFAEHGGIVSVKNTEGKWSDTKAAQIMRNYSPVLTVSNAVSQQDWQEQLNHDLSLIHDTANKKVDKRRKQTTEDALPPILFIVDSLVGSHSEKIQESVMKDGHGGKTYYDQAQVNNQFFGTWSPRLRSMPVSIVITNHLKDKIDAGPTSFIKQKITSGGTSTGFMCSLGFRVNRGKKSQGANYDRFELIISTHRNSLGRGGRKAVLPYYETYDEDGKQHSYVDYDEALVLLIEMLLDKGAAFIKERLKKLLGKITAVSVPGVGKFYSCDGLNISSSEAKEQRITASELGKRLQQGEMREQIKEALCVQRIIQWEDQNKDTP